MNIMQYRALKAQEAQVSQTVDQTPSTPTPQVETQVKPPEEPAKQETTPTQTPEVKVEPTPPVIPDKITIDGIGEVSIDELKNGYLRQTDYTQKTQEVARQKREVQDAVTFFEQIKRNPQVLQQITSNVQVPPTLDPATAKVIELENRVYDMMLEREIETLQNKYKDFEVKDVLEMAQKKNITNLEDAYHLVKSTKPQAPPQVIDTNALKEQLRKELLKEIEAERSATQTIITSNDTVAPVQDNSPKLSDAEKKVANMMRMSESDYVKWRDAGRKK